MKELPSRKPNRLEGYDYSKNGTYFITICLKDNKELLGQIDVRANCVRQQLSEHGIVVYNEILKLSETYNTVEIRKYVVMPNHLHMIIMICDNGPIPDGRTQFAPTPTISRIIKQFKGSVTKQIGFSIWQRSFHDHIIRNEKDYLKIWQYIDDNPMKWQDDCYYPKSNQA
jgi:REP element-mobilizing transposase RayT